MRTTGIDHIVLRSPDVERSVACHQQHLEIEAERLVERRAGDMLYPALRLSDTTIIDMLAGERSGTNVDHFAVVVEGADLDELAASGAFDVAAGPSDLWGARGQGRGLYVRDSDGNVVELGACG
jgi:hypothetical protein